MAFAKSSDWKSHCSTRQNDKLGDLAKREKVLLSHHSEIRTLRDKPLQAWFSIMNSNNPNRLKAWTITHSNSNFSNQNYRNRTGNGQAKHIIKRKISVISNQPQTLEEITISIPGVRKLLDPKSSMWVKAFWFLAIASCSGVCLYQLINRIRHYFQHPVSLEMSVRRLQTVDFPAITFCPSWNEEVFMRVAHLLNSSENLNEETAFKLLIPGNFQTNITTEFLWNYTKLDEDSIHVLTACKNSVRNDRACQDESFPVMKNFSDTVWGRCLVFTPASRMEYRGPQTYLRFTLNQSFFNELIINRPARNIQYFVHEKGISNRHDALFIAEDAILGVTNTVRLSVKEFNFINSSQHPCLASAAANECRNKCIDQRLNGILNCSLPFMRTYLRICRSVAEAVDSYKKIYKFYINLTSRDCVCPRKCHEMVFSMSTDLTTYDKRDDTDITSVYLYYSDNLLEIVEESYAYDFPALLSDIGGSLGFLLGFSVLTGLEMIEAILKNGLFETCRSLLSHNK